MSWNGSDNTSVGRSPRDRCPAPPAPRALRHGLVAGAIVIALGLAALWFFTRPASKTPTDDPRAPRNKPRNAIAEVAPDPTNDVQRKIWKEVHTPPSEPIKIKFDTKKGK